ncbi:MAG: hypothetical protein JWR08_1600 [Enterovirga sp.]|nr:hypothetical protein [Enterovirga sp.]
MRAARHGLYLGAADRHPGGPVAEPFPALGSTDRGHDPLAQHLRQRPPEPAEQAVAEKVHPHVVVFVERAGLAQVAALALAAVVGTWPDLAEMVDLVRLAEQLALPLARLLEQVAPRDAPVMRAVEKRILDTRPHRLVQVRDEPVVGRDAGQDGEVALGDRERHVRARRIAPLGHPPAALQDHACGAAARPHRADHLAPGPRLVPLDVPDIAAVRIVEAAGPGALMRGRERDRGVEPGRVETGRGGVEPLPRGGLAGAIRLVLRHAPLLFGGVVHSGSARDRRRRALNRPAPVDRAHRNAYPGAGRVRRPIERCR